LERKETAHESGKFGCLPLSDRGCGGGGRGEAIMNPKGKADRGDVVKKKIETCEIEPHAIDANAIEANPIEANRIEANPIEANRIEANPIEANAIDPNVIEPPDSQSSDDM
jgi:hypothetical protein